MTDNTSINTQLSHSLVCTVAMYVDTQEYIVFFNAVADLATDSSKARSGFAAIVLVN